MLKILRLLFAARIELINHRGLAPVKTKTTTDVQSIMANTGPLTVYYFSLKIGSINPVSDQTVQLDFFVFLLSNYILRLKFYSTQLFKQNSQYIALSKDPAEPAGNGSNTCAKFLTKE